MFHASFNVNCLPSKRKLNITLRAVSEIGHNCQYDHRRSHVTANPIRWGIATFVANKFKDEPTFDKYTCTYSSFMKKWAGCHMRPHWHLWPIADTALGVMTSRGGFFWGGLGLVPHLPLCMEITNHNSVNFIDVHGDLWYN